MGRSHSGRADFKLCASTPASVAAAAAAADDDDDTDDEKGEDAGNNRPGSSTFEACNSFATGGTVGSAATGVSDGFGGAGSCTIAVGLLLAAVVIDEASSAGCCGNRVADVGCD